MVNIGKARQIEGWMSDTELIWLAERAKHSKVIAEFGCYKGRSTKALADNHTGYVIYAVDPWHGDYYSNDGEKILFSCEVYDEFYSNLKDHIERDHVLPQMVESLKFVPIFRPDFIFIDGDHSYSAVKADIAHAFSISHPKSIIAGHDYGREDWPGVKQAVDEIFGNRKLIVDSIWWVEKN